MLERIEINIWILTVFNVRKIFELLNSRPIFRIHILIRYENSE